MTSRTLVAITAFAVIPLLGGCAASGERGPGSGVPSDLITREMINESPYEVASEVVRTLRPRWFQRAGPGRLSGGGRAEIQVYVDGSRRGGLQSLESIAATTIEEIRYLSPADATTNFGTGNAAGAILIVTRRN